MGFVFAKDLDKTTYGEKFWHRLRGVWNIVVLATKVLFGRIDAVFACGITAQYKDGEEKPPTAVEIQQAGFGDIRLMLLGVRAARDDLIGKLQIKDDVPAEIKAKLAEILGRLRTGDDTPGGFQFADENKECDCENCRTQRAKDGTTTNQDRARTH